jgi:hypothetical protein
MYSSGKYPEPHQKRAQHSQQEQQGRRSKMPTTPRKNLSRLKLFESPLDFSQFQIIVGIHEGGGHRHDGRST